MTKKKKERDVVRFLDEVPDLFVVMIQQTDGNFVICHNNNFECYCNFCSKIAGGIMELDKKLKQGK